MRARSVFGPLVLSTGMLVLGCAGCTGPSTGAEVGGTAALVIVQAPAGQAVHGSLVDPELRFPEGSRVVLAGDPSSATAVRVLSKGLLAAGAPATSPDGRRVLFAAQTEPAGAWAIHEAPLDGGRRRVVLQRADSCTDPAYLAGARFVVSCRDAVPSGAPRWSLYTADLAGAEPRRITFGPGDAFGPTPLADGRILFSMRQRQGPGRPSDDTVALFTVNPDGTLLDAFSGSHDAAAKFGARQVDAETVVFLEQTGHPTGPRLRRLDFQRPHRGGTSVLDAFEVDGAEPIVEAVEPAGGGALLIAVRRDATGSTIQRLLPRGGGLEDVFDEPGWDEIAAVPVMRREPPRGRPSPVDERASAGTLVCYDSTLGDGVVGPARSGPLPARVAVRVATGEGGVRTLGELPVAADGSFFTEVPADTALQVVTLDDDGEAIATSGWFWVRPGERRACFGCHEPRDAAPANRRVAALADDPVRLTAASGALP